MVGAGDLSTTSSNDLEDACTEMQFEAIALCMHGNN
jgi:hypothetical protein